METSQSMIDFLWFKSLLGVDHKNDSDSNLQKQEGETNTSTGTYLYKDYTTDSFQDQHNCHGQCIDASVVMHVRVILHTDAYDSLISQSHCGVLQKIQGFRDWLRQGWSMYILHVVEFNCLVSSPTVFDISSLKYSMVTEVLQKVFPGRDVWLVDL